MKLHWHGRSAPSPVADPSVGEVQRLSRAAGEELGGEFLSFRIDGEAIFHAKDREHALLMRAEGYEFRSWRSPTDGDRFRTMRGWAFPEDDE